MTALRVLLVDDETLARARLRTLLPDCREPTAVVAGEAAAAVEAMHQLQHAEFDLVLLDIHMPGTDGMALARAIPAVATPPAVVFVTAHAEHAVQAFELEAVDYLTKPRAPGPPAGRATKSEAPDAHCTRASAGFSEEVLIIQDRGKTLRVPLAEVLYLKAELKYVTVRTAEKSHILDGALSELEEKYATHFLRVHRNALVARRAIRALERHVDPEGGRRLGCASQWPGRTVGRVAQAAQRGTAGDFYGLNVAHPRSAWRRFPLKGAHPAARQSRFCGCLGWVPGYAMAPSAPAPIAPDQGGSAAGRAGGFCGLARTASCQVPGGSRPSGADAGVAAGTGPRTLRHWPAARPYRR